MSMISEQIKGLRKLANQWKHNDVAGCNLIFGACDTIEALSAKVRAEDRPTGSDFISKAKVLETYSDLYWFDIDCEVVSKAEVDKIYERLQSLPSADRSTGKWTDNHNGTFTCDQCGCKHSKSNYCPNCGADMRGDTE